MIWFISFDRPICSTELCDVLLQTAYLMLRQGERRKTFRHKNYEGFVETKFEQEVFVGTAGVTFQATVESEAGTNGITYLIRDRDVRRLDEIENFLVIPEGDLFSGDAPIMEKRPNPIRRPHGRN